MARLVIYEEMDGDEPVFEYFDLTAASRILIGSSLDNELVLDSPDVDATHASLELRHEQWIIQDLGGPGGTILNGQTISGPQPLHEDDLIEISSIKIKFQEGEGDPTVIEVEPEEESDAEAPHVSGRVWFAGVAGGTLAIIFLIILILVVAHYLNLLNISDLLPPWLFG